MEIAEIIDRMAAIKEEKLRLDNEYLGLQAKLQIAGEEELKNTKYKSVSFNGDKAKATITIADIVKNVTPSLFKDIFGKAYPDLVNVKHTEELTAEGKRMLAAVQHEAYCQGSVESLINSLKCDEKAKKSLLRKLNGKNFDTDKKNLMKIGGLSEKDASDTAYLAAEVISWNRLQTIIRINNDGEFSQEVFEKFLLDCKAAVCVEETTKISIESFA